MVSWITLKPKEKFFSSKVFYSKTIEEKKKIILEIINLSIILAQFNIDNNCYNNEFEYKRTQKVKAGFSRHCGYVDKDQCGNYIVSEYRRDWLRDDIREDLEGDFPMFPLRCFTIATGFGSGIGCDAEKVKHGKLRLRRLQQIDKRFLNFTTEYMYEY